MSTLAYKMRPTSLNDIIGQSHIVGENGIFTRFVEKKHPLSVILYGPPGCGKTTLAMALAHDLNIPYRIFNASTGNKKEMDAIVAEAKLSGTLFVIIDEVHRLNKMKQDNLLPYVESGLLIIAGCTTANPYHSINPAIRSRCQIVEVKPLTNKDIITGLKNALISDKGLKNEFSCDQEVLDYIARISSGDIRFAYNCLELCTIICQDQHIKSEDVKNAIPNANGQFDKDEDQYYDTLSGLQKSIRGSDPNGAMYYLAKLIEYDDIDSLERRVITCAYEDIGLANPNACMRTVMAFQAAKVIGFPEARIPIASAIIDLCLSPKSKSSENAIDNALANLKSQPLKAPQYLRLTPVGLQEDETYPYDRPELWEYIQYLPDQIAHQQFYVPWMTSQYEKALAQNYRRILQHGRTNEIKKLIHSKK
ncbi:replication-associated recombination protein A [Erysipelatoclostridium sp. AM42-17]|uniref:replication-associated recombination protein A n=1 Tax=Erysipelatoclostridium sp. AM42-17 TaxID=2293102 RepID=UPI000E48A476|nr:replication-associated recombination protein A [Erysipelatoclostridium sp. AM42-17]RHS96058.1 replication-associated recombination protein A [Erysipelatoclostridium sp. AM42-17]